MKNSARLKGKGFIWLVAVASLLILAAVNLGLEKLNDAAYLHIDLSRDSITELSESSKQALSSLGGELCFTVARKTGAKDELSRLIDELLERYQAQSPLVRVEHIDPELEPYRLSELDPGGEKVSVNTVYVTLDDKTRKVSGDSFLYQRTLDGQMYRLFCGDARLAGVIKALQSGVQKRAVFLTGHGEVSTSECQTLALSLGASGFEVLEGGADALKVDDVLYVLSPATDLTSEEALKLADFLDNGGAALFACGAETAYAARFSELLDLYGLAFERGAVVESVDETGRYIDLPDRLCPIAGENELLSGITQRLIFPSACAVAAPRRLGDVKTETLLATSARAYRKAAGNVSLYAFETGDASGAQTLMLSAESTSGGPRIVMLASTDMLRDDSAVTGAGVLDASDNLALLQACAAWLGGGDDIQASADLKVLPNYALTFGSEAERERTVWLSIAALPAAVALAAFAALLIRRRKVR